MPSAVQPPGPDDTSTDHQTNPSCLPVRARNTTPLPSPPANCQVARSAPANSPPNVARAARSASYSGPLGVPIAIGSCIADTPEEYARVRTALSDVLARVEAADVIQDA